MRRREAAGNTGSKTRSLGFYTSDWDSEKFRGKVWSALVSLWRAVRVWINTKQQQQQQQQQHNKRGSDPTRGASSLVRDRCEIGFVLVPTRG